MRASLVLLALGGSLTASFGAYAEDGVPHQQDGGGIPTTPPVYANKPPSFSSFGNWRSPTSPRLGGSFGREGREFTLTTGDKNEEDQVPSDSCHKAGDPVILSTGNEIQSDLDFMASGEMGLFLERTYNGHSWDISLFGYRWLSSFDYRLSFGTSSGSGPVGTCYARPSIAECSNAASHTQAWAHRPDGRLIKFTKAPDGVYYEDKPSPVSKMVLQADGTWLVTFEDNYTESYSKGGYPLWIQDEHGVRWTYSYGGLNGTQVQRVTHSSGRYVQFRWVDDELREIDDPAGNTVKFTYVFQKAEAGLHTLKTVVLPGTPATTITYHYAYEAGEPSGGFSALTGKSYNGVRYSSITYGGGGVASTELAGGVERHTFAYTTGANGAFSTTVTNPLGRKTTYDFQSGRLMAITGQPTAHCPFDAKGNQYDANGYLDISTDFNGNVTDYDYNAKGQLVKLVEGSGKPEARTTHYTWSATQNRITRVVLTGATQTDYVFTADNRLATLTLTNLSANGIANQARSTQYSYTRHPNGLLATATIDGPLPGTGDAIAYSYDTYGNLTSVQNSLGHTTSYSNYDALGQPGRVTGPNGDMTDYVYDARGRTTAKKRWINGAWQTTASTYDGFGRLARVQRPDGQVRNFEYDAAGRLVREYEEESSGVYAQKRYTYNNASNVTRIDTERATTPGTAPPETTPPGTTPPVTTGPVLNAPDSSANGSYTVSWSSVADSTHYRLEENVDGGTWSVVVNALVTSGDVVNKPNGTYGYRVQACNAAGCGPYSATASVVVALFGPPLAPTITGISSDGPTYQVSWTSMVGATTYRLEESTNGGSWHEVYNAPPTSTWLSKSLSASFSYRVRACNSDGCSAYSETVTNVVDASGSN